MCLSQNCILLLIIVSFSSNNTIIFKCFTQAFIKSRHYKICHNHEKLRVTMHHALNTTFQNQDMFISIGTIVAFGKKMKNIIFLIIFYMQLYYNTIQFLEQLYYGYVIWTDRTPCYYHLDTIFDIFRTFCCLCIEIFSQRNNDSILLSRPTLTVLTSDKNGPNGFHG